MAAGLDARAAAAQVIENVMQGQSLDRALKAMSPRVAERDQGLVAELSYGVCRWHPRLSRLLALMMDKPIKGSQQVVTALLMVGLYQLIETRVPEHAAVSETVGAVERIGKRWARGLVNALLRRFIREREALLSKVDGNEAARLDLPPWLAERLKRQWPDRCEQIAAGWQRRPPMALRVNSARIARDDYVRRLVEKGMTCKPSRLSASGILLDSPCAVTELPGFTDGLVSVQDCGAQVAAELLAPGPGDRVLDACAAPGGKTMHLLELQPQASVVAADIDEERLLRVQENLARLSLEAELTVADAACADEIWESGSFDRILLDVPCSATGVLRRHPDIRLLRRDSDIAPLVAMQRKILAATWTLLKPGGQLLYATCSVLAEENQQQVKRFLEHNADATEVALSVPGAVSLDAGIQLLPVDDATDGFYYALLEKRA
jgi:16S rRNA (cytosine967-C5)-methyltransferase